MVNLSENEKKEFSKLVREWVDLTDTIKEAMADMKTLKEQKTEVEDDIEIFMTQHGIPNIIVGDETIKLEEKETRKALPKKTKDDLTLQLIGQSKFEELANLLDSSRETVTSKKVKRKANKKKK